MQQKIRNFIGQRNNIGWDKTQLFEGGFSRKKKTKGFSRGRKTNPNKVQKLRKRRARVRYIGGSSVGCRGVKLWPNIFLDAKEAETGAPKKADNISLQQTRIIRRERTIFILFESPEGAIDDCGEE